MAFQSIFGVFSKVVKIGLKWLFGPFLGIFKMGQNWLKMAFQAILRLFSKVAKSGLKWLFSRFLGLTQFSHRIYSQYKFSCQRLVQVVFRAVCEIKEKKIGGDRGDIAPTKSPIWTLINTQKRPKRLIFTYRGLYTYISYVYVHISSQRRFTTRSGVQPSAIIDSSVFRN